MYLGMYIYAVGAIALSRGVEVVLVGSIGIVPSFIPSDP